jgi:hypothetical protein
MEGHLYVVQISGLYEPASDIKVMRTGRSESLKSINKLYYKAIIRSNSADAPVKTPPFNETEIAMAAFKG